MKKIAYLILPLLLIAACDTSTLSEETECAYTSADIPVGAVQSVATFESGDRPEGIAVDCPGNLYVGVRNGDTSRIERIAPGGTRSTFATLPDQSSGGTGVLGLTVDRDGIVYAAHGTRDAKNGIYRIGLDGIPVHLPGSEAMTSPNAVALGPRGLLYATDSFGPASLMQPGGGCAEATQCGSVWKVGNDGVMRPWLTHPLLASFENPGAPFAVPGPNGIAFFPPNKMYIANTSGGMIVEVEIAADGSPGTVRMHSQSLQYMATLDGIAVDVSGSIYGVMAAANAEEIGAPPVPAVAKVTPDGSVQALISDTADFDAPTSLTFGSGPRARSCLFVVNAALYGPVTQGPGASIVEVNVGADGLLFQ